MQRSSRGDVETLELLEVIDQSSISTLSESEVKEVVRIATESDSQEVFGSAIFLLDQRGHEDAAIELARIAEERFGLLEAAPSADALVDRKRLADESLERFFRGEMVEMNRLGFFARGSRSRVAPWSKAYARRVRFDLDGVFVERAFRSVKLDWDQVTKVALVHEPGRYPFASASVPYTKRTLRIEAGADRSPIMIDVSKVAREFESPDLIVRIVESRHPVIEEKPTGPVRDNYERNLNLWIAVSLLGLVAVFVIRWAA